MQDGGQSAIQARIGRKWEDRFASGGEYDIRILSVDDGATCGR